MKKSDFILGISIPIVGFLMIACASTFDASSIHHTFGVGKTTHVVHDSTSVNSTIK